MLKRGSALTASVIDLAHVWAGGLMIFVYAYFVLFTTFQST